MTNLTSMENNSSVSNYSSPITTPWLFKTSDHEPPNSPIPFIDITLPPCKWILQADILNSGVRWWDLFILVPNFLFILFLLYSFRVAIGKLRGSNSPIFAAFYGLIFAVPVISLLRCVVSMLVNASLPAGDITDKVLWLVLRFFLLATELSVVIFGLGFGHLDSHTSIRRVLMVTFTVALAYSIIQGTLELEYPAFTGQSKDNNNSNSTISYDLFAQGGMIFLFTTSIFFFLVYTVIALLPLTRLKERFLLPTKRLFYYYCLSLAALNLVQAVASLLVYMEIPQSLCVVDATTYLYFSFYIPLVYGVFLWKFFKAAQTGLQFSYKHQEDVIDDEHVSLPYSNGAGGKQDDMSPIYSYDSTHFDVQFSRAASRGSAVSDANSSFRNSYSVNSDFYNISVET
ncbi:transmembrane protein adipocyte-associated 1 homolog [Physella acuta]|uniref:transmembrane protein adipocyte-associated 1 homolog n=1 Tax=Physella acuta TaxID=109671 RepID=UPI0027DCCD08|nr:transmembrane protein adipocyte-associated 1 homolog [Physella acuta]